MSALRDLARPVLRRSSGRTRRTAVDQVSLGEHVRRYGPLDGESLQRVVRATASALAAVHEAGQVHGDFGSDPVVLGSQGSEVVRAELLLPPGAASGGPGPVPDHRLEAGQARDVFGWAVWMVFAATGSLPTGVAAAQSDALWEDLAERRVPDPLRTLLWDCVGEAWQRPTAREVLYRVSQDLSAVGGEPGAYPDVSADGYQGFSPDAYPASYPDPFQDAPAGSSPDGYQGAYPDAYQGSYPDAYPQEYQDGYGDGRPEASPSTVVISGQESVGRSGRGGTSSRSEALSRTGAASRSGGRSRGDGRSGSGPRGRSRGRSASRGRGPSALVRPLVALAVVTGAGLIGWSVLGGAAQRALTTASTAPPGAVSVGPVQAATGMPGSSASGAGGTMAVPPGGAAAGLTGRWQGTLTQSSSANALAVRVILNGRQPGTITLPGIGCTGTLTVRQDRPERVVYQDTLTQDLKGQCARAGKVTIDRVAADTLRLVWINDAAPHNSAAGLLRPA